MKYRKILIIMAVIAVLAFAGWLGTAVSKGAFNSENADDHTAHERTNTQTKTEERVFDMADKLTDSEESELREKIARCEKKTACDIVLVVLDETLENYEPSGSNAVFMDDPEDWICAFADDFWDDNFFGYNKGIEGDGIILVDNWFREPADGKIHSWISTSGRAYAELGSSEIDEILDEVYDYIEKDPCRAYSEYVDAFCDIMEDADYAGEVHLFTLGWYTFAVPVVLSLILFIFFWMRRKGSSKVNEMTYVSSDPDSVRIMNKTDVFLHKCMTRQRIQNDENRSSGGGFGGGHVSSGGMSHGGGGHSR